MLNKTIVDHIQAPLGDSNFGRNCIAKGIWLEDGTGQQQEVWVDVAATGAPPSAIYLRGPLSTGTPVNVNGFTVTVGDASQG